MNNDVIVALREFISTYGEGEHTSKEIFNYGKAKGVKGLYPATVKHAARAGRGKFNLTSALADSLENQVTAKQSKAKAATQRKEQQQKEAAERKAARDAERTKKAAERDAARKERAANKAAQPAKVKAATVRAAKAKQQKDTNLSNAASSGGAVLQAKQLGGLGYQRVDQPTANKLYGEGHSVLVVDRNIGDTATPPIATDLTIKSESMEFYAKQ